MKARLNLIIDSTLVEDIKGYALKRQTSVSELVENYLNLSRSLRKGRILLQW